MYMQTQPITRKPLLTTLCLALVSLLAACDKPQADKAAKPAPQAAATAAAANIVN